MKLSSRFWAVGVAALATVFASAAPALADKTPRRFEPQIALKTDRTSRPSTGAVYDCYQKTKRFGGLMRGLQSSDEAKHRKLVVRAAREALNKGYNYMVLAPMRETVDQFDTASTRWETVGTGYGFDMFGGYMTSVVAPVERRNISRYGYYYLDCKAVDDVDAYAIMWDAHTTYSPADGESLVDIRSLLSVLGPKVEGSRYQAPPPRLDKVTSYHFRHPGDRERIALQISTMRRAADCRRAHTTLNSSLQAQQSPSQASAIRACLEPLSADARAVGWSSFPLFLSENAASQSARGYTVTPTAAAAFGSTAPSGPNASGRIPAPPEYGASQWEMTPIQPPAFDGIALFQKTHPGRPRRQIVLGSNTHSRAELLDYAVFHLANEMMRERNNGIVATDETQTMRDRFERYDARVREDVRREQARYADEKAAYDAQMRDLAKMRADYDRTRAQYPDAFTKTFDEIAGPEPQPPVPPAANASSGRASVEAGRDDYKGVFRVMEEYANVIYLWGYNPPACDAKYIFCADKLQAYNAIGARIMGPDFRPLSEPSGYEPFDPRVR